MKSRTLLKLVAGGLGLGVSVLAVTALAGVTYELTKLVPDVGAQYEYFGYSLDISSNTIVVGESGYGANGSGIGRALVFTGTGALWTQQAELAAADGAMGDSLGLSVAISGDTVLAGAWLADAQGIDSGSAYVFVRNAGVWTQQMKISPADGAAGDSFGRSVALSGDTAVIGAYADDDK